MEKYNQFIALIYSLDRDAIKFFQIGNTSAVRRLRKRLQKVKASAHSLRKEVSNIKLNH